MKAIVFHVVGDIRPDDGPEPAIQAPAGTVGRLVLGGPACAASDKARVAGEGS